MTPPAKWNGSSKYPPSTSPAAFLGAPTWTNSISLPHGKSKQRNRKHSILSPAICSVRKQASGDWKNLSLAVNFFFTRIALRLLERKRPASIYLKGCVLAQWIRCLLPHYLTFAGAH